jgi:hypothetical protein
VVERELLLARLQDVPQVLHPHLPPALPPLLPPDRTRTRRRTSTAAAAAVTPNFKFRFAFLSLQTPNSNLQNALWDKGKTGGGAFLRVRLLNP